MSPKGGSGDPRLSTNAAAINSDQHQEVSDVLVRDIPDDDLALIRSARSAAADQGVSLQHYLRDALRAQASYLRRRAALARTAGRLRGVAEAPADERAAVLEAIAKAHEQRANQLSGRPAL